MARPRQRRRPSRKPPPGNPRSSAPSRPGGAEAVRRPVRFEDNFSARQRDEEKKS
jgi:hypothetical protein